MKIRLLVVTILSLTVLINCNKTNVSDLNTSPIFCDGSIKDYLKSRLNADEYSNLDFSSIKSVKIQDGKSFTRISEKNNRSRFIVLANDSHGYEGYLADLSDLHKTKGIKLSGVVSKLNLQTGEVQKLTIIQNAVYDVVTSISSARSDYSSRNLFRDTVSTPDNPKMLDEFVVTARESSINYASMFWLFNQNYSYEGAYIGSPNNGNLSSNSSYVTAPKFISPDHPISDIREDLGCFTKQSTSTFTISINVNQPVPNNREISDLSAKFLVGHTFFTLSEQQADGNLIIRNVGFYPKTKAKVGDPTDKGIFGDDSYTPYSVSLKFSASAGDFDQVKNALIKMQQGDYNLYTFNCTNAAIYALRGININLPATLSNDLLFTGNDPADLGEDIRALNLNSFSAQNGNRPFIRTVSNSNNLTPPQKAGSCEVL